MKPPLTIFFFVLSLLNLSVCAQKNSTALSDKLYNVFKKVANAHKDKMPPCTSYSFQFALETGGKPSNFRIAASADSLYLLELLTREFSSSSIKYPKLSENGVSKPLYFSAIKPCAVPDNDQNNLYYYRKSTNDLVNTLEKIHKKGKVLESGKAYMFLPIVFR
jgi:hypothetical protein